MSKSSPTSSTSTSSSLFSSVSRYIQEVKEQVDAKAPGIIAQAKNVLETQTVAIQKAVGVAPPASLVESLERQKNAEENLEQKNQSVSAEAVESSQDANSNSAMTSLESGKEEKIPSPNLLTNLNPANLPTLAQLTSSSCICPSCSSALSIIESLIPTNKCRVCGQLFCSKCIGKSSLPVPSDLLHSDFRPKQSVATVSTASAAASKEEASDSKEKIVLVPDDIQYVCKSTCNALVTRRVMEIFRDEINEKFESNFNDFIIHEHSWKEYFPFPSTAPEDTTYRQAIRAAQIAVFVADLTGFSLTLKAVKVMYFGSEIFNILIKGDILPMLSPLLESLKAYGIDGPSALLRLYYLGCQHTLRAAQLAKQPKLRTVYDERQHPSVLCPHCPYGVMAYLARYVSAAEWLYHTQLPSPHNTMEWSSWYLTKLVRRQGWTVLMGIHETTKLPDGLKCPAFAVLTRVRGRQSEKRKLKLKVKKEALIVVRGSASPMDWTINLQEELHDDYTYAYFHPSVTAHCGSMDAIIESNESVVQVANGYIHKGIHDSAMAMLDRYNLRSHIVRLIQAGYEVKCVGHSLGAGVAGMLALEIRNMMVTQYLQQSEAPATATPVSATMSTEAIVRAVWHKVHRVTAVVFACPAFLSPLLAHATLADRLLLNVVNGSDAIPRFSHRTLALLANELKENEAQASQWMDEDKLDLQTYITQLGKAGELHTCTAESQRERRLRLEIARSKSTQPTSIESEVSLTPGLDGGSLAPESFALKAQRTAEESLSTLKNVLEYWQLKATPTLMKTTSSLTSSTITAAGDGNSVAAETAIPVVVPGATADISLSASSAVVIPEAAVTETAASVPPVASRKKDLRETVTPGPIIHIYRENTGAVQAAVVTWEHELFHRLEILPTHGLKDHDMHTYRSMIDAVKFQYSFSHAMNGQDHRVTGRHTNSVDGTERDISLVFPVDVHLWQEEEQLIRSHKDSNASTTSDEDESMEAAEVAIDIEDAKAKCERRAEESQPCEIKISEPVTPKVLTRQSSTASFVSAAGETANCPTTASKLTTEDEMFKDCLSSSGSDSVPCVDAVCNVCGLDVTWPYMLHSDAARAMATHYCSVCQAVVCTYCAPAGDVIPGEGLNQTVTLRDMRLTLPWLGIFTPQRVCWQCYFDSSHPGLAMMKT